MDQRSSDPPAQHNYYDQNDTQKQGRGLSPVCKETAQEKNTMSNPTVKLYIQGEGADKAVQEIIPLIAELYETKPEVHSSASSAVAGEPRKIDPATGIALAGLVLSIPAAIMAALDLADRIKKRKKAERLIQWARQKRESAPQLQIHIELSACETSAPDALLNSLSNEWLRSS